ncbi:Cell division cycle protein 123-like protein [Sciurus carolinensis]|uniref:Translation initiation factor eIF2 assembly protein n=1 Tax=Sciurus carolinensis TaxID=30640 RepID=A0AA41MV45_SCICA|nr:Cell division cycle protein 123-like protein [Sciurus carolinensis]
MKKEHVLHCQFSAWYPLFRSLTIKRGFSLHNFFFIFFREDPPTRSQPDSDDETEEIQWSDDENTATLTAPEFPEFATKVQEAINSLGGSVFPKLNWSAPRLVLRKWCELIPGAEFRCFVKENKLIVVFDIYRDSRGKVWLIDFNPFGEVTDSLLFTWEELISGKNLKGDFSEGDAQEQDSPAFRCTNSEVTVQPSPYLSYRLPKDFVDLSTGEDAHKLIDFLKLVKYMFLFW